MYRLERYLFPRSILVNFVIIACLSFTFSFLLTGRQIFQANWGVIDDHEVFRYLGPGLHLSTGDVWSTLLDKTEVGTLQGRFRPSYYLIKVMETVLFGSNVHLWYLGNTIAFAIFLSSVWWALRRFVGGWLSGALTASISLLPLWSDVWSRLGPSEIGGAACVGVMIFAADFILFSDNPRTRNGSAIALALATIALVGMKETFIPLAGGTAVIFVLALRRRKLPLVLIACLSMLIVASVGGIGFVVTRQTLGRGADYYGNAAGPWPAIKFGIIGVVDSLLRTCWLFILPIIFFQLVELLPRKPTERWVSESRVAVGTYLFLVVMYAAQCALYRSLFPHNSRYDFPAMLLVPLVCCILVSEISHRAGKQLPKLTIEYAQLTAAGFLSFTLILIHVGRPPALAVAAQANIKATNLFYNELQRLVRSAKESPESPIILDAYGPLAYEAVTSLSYYIPALGATNRIAVRFHADETYKGAFYDGLQQSLSGLQEVDSGAFTSLQKILADRSKGCLSIGINGRPDFDCSGFQVRSGPVKLPDD